MIYVLQWISCIHLFAHAILCVLSCHLMYYKDEIITAPLLSNVKLNDPPTYCVLQYPLYTIMFFDEWRNNILVAFFVVSCTREQNLRFVLDALHYKVKTLNIDWK